MEKHEIRKLLIDAQNDLLRMMGNAETQAECQKAIDNKFDYQFFKGNVYAFEYACKHLTNILELTE